MKYILQIQTNTGDSVHIFDTLEQAEMAQMLLKLANLEEPFSFQKPADHYYWESRIVPQDEWDKKKSIYAKLLPIVMENRRKRKE